MEALVNRVPPKGRDGVGFGRFVHSERGRIAPFLVLPGVYWIVRRLKKEGELALS